MIPDGDITRLWDSFVPFEASSVFDHPALITMANLVFLLTSYAPVGIVYEQQATEEGETLHIANFLVGENAEHKPHRNQNKVLENA